jgi:thiol-disulfide isomerase/thioredoxin
MLAMGRAVLMAGLLVPLASGCDAGTGKGAAHAVSEHALIGAAAPPLDVPAPDGKGRVQFDAQAGKVTIVDFWATWCEPCRESFPAYQKLADEFGGKVVVIGVSVDESPEPIAGFVKATGVKFRIGWDEGQAAARSYEPPTMPTSFIVDRSGIVRFVHGGYSRGDEKQLREELKSLL